MSLIRMRERARKNAPFHFSGPPSWGRAWACGIGALLLMGFTAMTGRVAGFLLASILAIVAAEDVRRLRQRLLPRRFLCPACHVAISLKWKERQGVTFTCPRCQETFEVEEER